MAPAAHTATTDARRTAEPLWRRIVASATAHGFHVAWAGGLFLAMVAALGVAAINNDANLLLLVFGLGLGAAVTSGVVTASGLRRVRVQRLAPAGAIAGQPFVVGYRLRNARSFTAAYSISVEELIDDDALRGGWPEVYAPLVDPGQSATADVTVCVTRRGRLRLDAVRMSTRFPLSLFLRYKTLRLPGEMLIYPAVGRLRRPVWKPGRMSLRSGDGRRTNAEGNEEFYGLRDYRHGDNPRWIHWRRSARTGKLVMRQMAEQAPVIGLVVVDTHAHGPDADARRESAIRLAATLCCEGIESEYQIGLIADGEPPAIVPPAGGQHHVTKLLSALALLEEGAALADMLDRVPWSTRWGRPSCVLVAAVDDDRTRAVAARLAPRCAEVTTFVAGTPAFDDVFAEPALDAPQT